MSTLTRPLRPPTFDRTAGSRIVERTTTITREVILDTPTPRRFTLSAPSDAPARRLCEVSEAGDAPIGGFDRALIRLGAWLIGLGRARALRQSRGADEIGRRLDEAKNRNMKHFIGPPN